MWSELTWYMWSDFFKVKWSEVKWSEVKWSEVSYVEVLGVKVPLTLGWPYTEGNWSYCNYFMWCVSWTVVVLTCLVIYGCVYVWVVCTCGCFDNCMGVLLLSVLAFTVLYIFSFMCIYSNLLLVQGLQPSNKNSIAVNNTTTNNNNNNKVTKHLSGHNVSLAHPM